MRTAEPDRFERAALRLLARFCVERREATLAEVQAAAWAFENFADEAAALDALQRRCSRYWSSDHGFSISYSQDGRDAESVLRRLGTLDGLDVLADPERLALLRALAPMSRVKLSRRFVAEAKEVGTELDEEAIAERLADVGLFLEVEARTSGSIASAMGTSKRTVLELLPPLVEAGFVRRAREVRCPQCAF